MFLPDIRTDETDKEEKRLELIGQRLESDIGDLALAIKLQFCVTRPADVALQLEEIFPLYFKHFEKKTLAEWEKWCEQYDAECDPPMDQFHYLRPQL
jgi:hypothetical protein